MKHACVIIEEIGASAFDTYREAHCPRCGARATSRGYGGDHWTAAVRAAADAREALSQIPCRVFPGGGEPDAA